MRATHMMFLPVHEINPRGVVKRGVVDSDWTLNSCSNNQPYIQYNYYIPLFVDVTSYTSRVSLADVEDPDYIQTWTLGHKTQIIENSTLPWNHALDNAIAELPLHHTVQQLNLGTSSAKEWLLKVWQVWLAPHLCGADYIDCQTFGRGDCVFSDDLQEQALVQWRSHCCTRLLSIYAQGTTPQP